MKTREHRNQGEPGSLWVLLVTPSRAAFSSLEFKKYFYGLKHTVLGEDGLEWAMEAKIPLLLLDAECWLPSCAVQCCAAII